MNIFFLHENPRIAAEWHGDKHVSKMLLETAQMLSTSHHVQGFGHSELYKPTHINHPCSLWVRENKRNYHWTWNLLCALCYEFEIRRGKKHATERLVIPLSYQPDLPFATDRTPPALAMPDEFKTACPVESYRRYYQQKFLDGIVCYNWSDERTEPDWILKHERT